MDLEIRLGAGDEEAPGVVQPIQPLEVEEAAIHQVERPRLGHQLIEDVDLVQLAVADMDEGRNIATQIEQGVQFDRRLRGSERGPRKHRQAEVDGGRIERVDRLLQVDAERFLGIQRSRDVDQALSEIGIDAPVAHAIGVGQRVARDDRPQPQVIELGSLRTQTRFDVAQALPIRELRERHNQELIQARERFDLPLAMIPTHTAAKRGQRKMLQQLREHQLALVHRVPPRYPLQGHRPGVRRSNRDQGKAWLTLCPSITY